jgi:y4mF family transcriptional regulator
MYETYTRMGIVIRLMPIIQLVKQTRKELGLTQADLASKAGVGLRFIRDLEQGKKTLRMDKVNQVLSLLGYELGAVKQ